METRLFEMLYEMIATALSQLPAVFEAYASLPLAAQEILLVIVMALSITIIVNIVLGIMKFCSWWADKH